MEHEDYHIDILDESGNVVGTKPRREIDKMNDIVHCVEVFVFRDAQTMMLGRLPDENSWTPGTWAPPSATMLRHGERPEEAAKRALKKELGLAEVELHALGEHFFTFSDGVKRKKTSFWIRPEEELTPNPDDVAELKPFTRAELESAMVAHPEQFRPVFEQLWAQYKDMLPF